MGYRAKKRLGQHFLRSGEVIQRIIGELDPEPAQCIIEIGPGRGSLTLPLAETGVKLWGIEFDRDQIGYLNKLTRKHSNVHIVNADILSYEPDSKQLPEFGLISNLPYNITSPVLDWCNLYRKRITVAVLMVQEEVALRVAASPGNKDWSPLSIFTQLNFSVEYRFKVPPSSFNPPPKVSSAVIRLIPMLNVQPVTPAFKQVVRAAFKQRRKLLVNNLVPELISSSEEAKEILTANSLPQDCRAEQVSTDQFLRLTEELIERKLV